MSSRLVFTVPLAAAIGFAATMGCDGGASQPPADAARDEDSGGTSGVDAADDAALALDSTTADAMTADAPGAADTRSETDSGAMPIDADTGSDAGALVDATVVIPLAVVTTGAGTTTLAQVENAIVSEAGGAVTLRLSVFGPRPRRSTWSDSDYLKISLNVDDAPLVGSHLCTMTNSVILTETTPGTGTRSWYGRFDSGTCFIEVTGAGTGAGARVAGTFTGVLRSTSGAPDETVSGTFELPRLL